MSAFAEFCLVALALFLWESIVWIPLRSVCLHVAARGKKIRIQAPDRWFATKRSGCVFHSWWPGSTRVIPTQTIPLLIDTQERWLLQRDDGRYVSIAAPKWEDIQWLHPYLTIGAEKVKLASGRCMEVFWQGKKAGLTPADALRKAWKESLSTTRVAAVWKKWRLVSAPLRWLQALLFMGFVGGLVLYHSQSERFPIGFFLAWIFLVMVMIAGHVWWLARKVYPSCKSHLMMDVVLCCLVPFHAMRAAESAVLHVLGQVNPYAFLFRYAPEHPWLRRQLRILSHPRAGSLEDEILFSAYQGIMAEGMRKKGLQWEDFDHAPCEAREADEVSYCPRCHARYLEGVDACRDCRNYPLRRFGS